MKFGNQTITIVTVSEGATRDRYNNPPEVVRTPPNVVTGCRVRPLSATETVALGDVVTDARRPPAHLFLRSSTPPRPTKSSWTASPTR